MSFLKYLSFSNNYFYNVWKAVETFNAINGFIQKFYDKFSRNNGRI